MRTDEASSVVDRLGRLAFTGKLFKKEFFVVVAHLYRLLHYKVDFADLAVLLLENLPLLHLEGLQFREEVNQEVVINIIVDYLIRVKIPDVEGC